MRFPVCKVIQPGALTCSSSSACTSSAPRSVHGRYPQEVTGDEHSLTIGAHKIKTFAAK